MSIIKKLKEDEELKELRKKWMRKFVVPFPLFNMDEYLNISDYKIKIKEALKTGELEKAHPKINNDFLAENKVKEKKWKDNIINIEKNKIVGKCPYCGSENTDYGFVVLKSNTKVYYGSVWCNDCKQAFHIPKNEFLGDILEKDIPKDLIY